MRTRILITVLAVFAMLGLSMPAQAIVNGEAGQRRAPHRR